MGAISQTHDALNSSETSNMHAASDDTLSVAVHVSHTPNISVSALYLLFILPSKGGQAVQSPPVQGCCYLCTLKGDKLATCQFPMVGLDTFALVIMVQAHRVNNDSVFVRPRTQTQST